MSTAAYGVNDAGTIVGKYINLSEHGFSYVNGIFRTMDFGSVLTSTNGINRGGEMVGFYSNSGVDLQGFLSQGQHLITINFPGATRTGATGVSGTGVIVGEYHDSNAHIHGFVLQGGAYASIDYPAALVTLATGVNSSHVIVGVYLAAKEGRNGVQ